MQLYMSPSVVKKLKDKHSLEVSEVQEVWDTYNGIALEDIREQHRSNPATMWFVAKTSKGRILKLAYVPEDDVAYLRTAYDANAIEIRLFRKLGGVI